MNKSIIIVIVTFPPQLDPEPTTKTPHQCKAKPIFQTEKERPLLDGGSAWGAKRRAPSLTKMRRMATVALVSSTKMGYIYRSKGISFLLSLNFNPVVGDIGLLHTQIPRNPFAPDSVAKMGPTQVQKLVFEKHKLGFDKLDDALSLFRRMVQIRSRLSVINFCQLLTAIARMKQYSVVISLFREIRELRIPIDEYTLVILINCFCRVNRVDFAFAILGVFFKCGHKANVVAFNALINGYILQDKTADAVKLFLTLVKDGEIIPDEVTYGTIINGLCKIGNTKMALQLVRSMHKWNLKPHVVIYNTIIDNLCKDGNIDDAFCILSEMREWDAMPDVVTFTCLVDGLCKSGRWMDATRIMRHMIEQNIVPNVITFKTMVDAFCKEGETKEAESILGIMMRKGKEPDVVTYNALMDGYCLQGLMDKAKEVFNSMVDRGLEPNVWSYNILINGYCKRRNIDEAMHLFREMARKGLIPGTDTYTTLLQGLFMIGSCNAASGLFNEMISRGQNPNIFTYSVLLDGFFKNNEIVKAVEVFRSMQDHGMTPNLVVYCILINGMCKAGKIEDARKLFSSISAKGLKPNVKIYTAMISGLCKETLLDEAEELLLQMERNGCPPNEVTYNVVVRAFLERGDKHKVIILLQEMINRSFSPDSSNTETLIRDRDYLEMIQNLVSRDKKPMS